MITKNALTVFTANKPWIDGIAGNCTVSGGTALAAGFTSSVGNGLGTHRPASARVFA